MELTQYQKDIIFFLIRHPYFASNIISINYKIPDEFLLKYSDCFTNKIIFNNSINLKLIGYVEPYCHRLSINDKYSRIPIEIYDNDGNSIHFPLKYLTKPIADKLIFDYKNEIMLFDRYPNKKWAFISEDIDLEMVYDFFEKYRNKINWDYLSEFDFSKLPFEFLDKYKDYFNWSKLAVNQSINFTEKYLIIFQNYIDWDTLSKYGNINFNSIEINDFSLNNMGHNQHFLNSSIDLLEKHVDIIDPESFSHFSKFVNDIDFVEKHINLVNWERLSYNEYFIYSEYFFDKYVDKIDFIALSKNKYFNWTLEFVEKYKNRLKWKLEKGEWQFNCINAGLSNNHKIPWTHEFIRKHQERFDFGCYIVEYEKDDDIDGNVMSSIMGLSQTNNGEWSLNMLIEFEDKWEYNYLSRNEKCYKEIFEPILNDEIVETVLKLIDKTDFERNNDIQAYLYENIVEQF
jgi:hypothetical protein